mgnify:CR=1 FL=1
MCFFGSGPTHGGSRIAAQAYVEPSRGEAPPASSLGPKPKKRTPSSPPPQRAKSKGQRSVLRLVLVEVVHELGRLHAHAALEPVGEAHDGAHQAVGDPRVLLDEVLEVGPVQGGRASLEPGEAVLAMSRCPLVDEWRDMGLPDRDVETLCRIAHAVDFGTWEGALPFALRFECTRGQGRDAWVLRVTKARAASLTATWTSQPALRRRLATSTAL